MTGMFLALLGGKVQIVTDQFFEYTTLLLPGNGTNGAQNNTFLDGSTNNFTITRNGNTTQGTFSPFSQTGWGNYFNGTNAYLSTPSITIGSGDFTIEGWQYILPDGTDYGRVVGIGDFQTSSGLGINFNPSTLKFEITTGNSTIITSSGTFSYNIWYHISLVRSGNTVTLYVNGTSQGSVVNTNSISGVVYISAINYLSTIYYGASYTSNVRITTTAIVPPAGGPTAPLTAVTGTLLLTCQSNRFIDTNTQAAAKTITVNGSPSVVAFSPFNPTSSWSATTNGGSGYFDGSGDYLSVADNAAFTMGTGDFTVEYWVYWNGTSSTFRAYGQVDSGGSSASVSIRGGTDASNKVINGAFSGTTDYLCTSTASLVANTWNHIAFVRDGTTLRQYINGGQDGTASISTASVNDSSSQFAIGRAGEFNGNYFGGYISSFRLLKGTCLYPSGTAFTPPTAPLTNITNTSLLLNFTNAGIYDATSKNDLETVGNAQISTTQSKWGGSSMSFDGTGDYLTIPSNQSFNFGSADFTIEGWFYQTGLSSLYPGIVSNLIAFGTDAWAVLSSHNSSGVRKLQFYSYNYSSTVPLLLGTTTLSDNTWYYFAVARSGSTFRLFLNGTQEASQTFSGSVNTASNSACAVGTNQTSFQFQGYLQDLRITKGYARYTANFTAPTAAFPTL